MVLPAHTTRPIAAAAVYQPRRPRQSPLWKCVHDHFDAFRRDYDRKHIARHGPLRPVVIDVVEKYLDCGDLHRGFARVRCPTCKLEYLLAFSCKTRGFCPSCQQKRTVAGAECLVAEVFAATDFLAAVTQHIPDKGFQLVKYYGYYSNKARGQRAKPSAEAVRRGSPDPAAGPTAGLPDTPPAAARSRKIPSRT